MGGWDGRRGWIYHVATSPEVRRTGLATRMVRDIQARLRALGCWKVNVMVRAGNDDGEGFWPALGYERSDARQYARELHDD